MWFSIIHYTSSTFWKQSLFCCLTFMFVKLFIIYIFDGAAYNNEGVRFILMQLDVIKIERLMIEELKGN